MPNFDLGDYVDVNERLAWFFDRYPEGSLQADILERGEGYVIIKALAYRSPMDDRPGSGMASEPVPGRTPYTKDSEVMVGETSAWGRALAAIGAPTKGTIASKQEVRNRRPSPAVTEPAAERDVASKGDRGASGHAVDSMSPAGGTSSGPEAGGISAKPAQDPGPDSTSVVGEAAGVGTGGGSAEAAATHSAGPASPGSTKTYPLDPTKCSHKFPSGRWLKWDEFGNCPRCGTPQLVAMESTTADLGPA
jgi:hypothetical protein